jgi:integrase/recombinase XerD
MRQCRSVNLTLRVDGKFYPVEIPANGRVRAGVAFKDGQETKFETGWVFYIDWREQNGSGTQRKRLQVGTDPMKALAALRRQETVLAAKAQGIAVAAPALAEGESDDNLRPVADAIATFLADVKEHRKPKTYSAYRTALEYFGKFCPKAHLEEITKEDMKGFTSYLRSQKIKGGVPMSDRSVYNKFEICMSFLKFHDITLKRVDWPGYTEEVPDAYEREELDKLFAACTAEERLWFEFFLMTGEREQEVMHTYWSDINWSRSLVKISHKPDRNWTPKAYKEREIPVPARLIESLRKLRDSRNKKCNLVFPTAGCKPKLDFLDGLKKIVKRAGLEGDWFLHKFRATFACYHLWAGVDIRTVQAWMGHTDLASTMRYLKPNRDAHVKVEATFAGS